MFVTLDGHVQKNVMSGSVMINKILSAANKILYSYLRHALNLHGMVCAANIAGAVLCSGELASHLGLD